MQLLVCQGTFTTPSFVMAPLAWRLVCYTRKNICSACKIKYIKSWNNAWKKTDEGSANELRIVGVYNTEAQ